MSGVIGIDLGTTFSAVATLDESGRPVVVHNSEGKNITPSCVLVEDESISVGEIARKEWGISKNRVGARFKRDMGTESRYRLDSQSFSPQDLSCFVLKHLKQEAEASIGPIKEAVVTIPANFSNEAREATLTAAKQAGLNVQHIINEPTAAALFYAWKSGQDLRGNFAVYDLGGGTFDVSIIRVEGQDISVLASHGVAKLGGDDFDAAIQKLVSTKYAKATGDALEDGEFSKNDAEEVKVALSKREEFKARAGGKIITITRSEFEESISSFIAQAEMLCESALEEAGVDASDITGVFLAGGSTRVPAVRKSVAQMFGQEPVSTANVDEVVALGAALYAAYKGDKKNLSPLQKAAVGKISLTEVTNWCFGTISRVQDEGRGGYKLENAVLIHKNEAIPCSVQQSFYTISDNQTAVNCRVTQSKGPERDPKFVKVVWEGSLELPPGRPQGQEIILTYGFDENGVMSCSFRDAETGEDISVNLSNVNTTETTSNIDRFMVE